MNNLLIIFVFLSATLPTIESYKLPPRRIRPNSFLRSSESQYEVSARVAASNVFLDSLFSYKPFFNVIKEGARNTIINRAEKIGVRWSDEVASMERSMDKLTDDYNRLLNSKLEYPSYFLKPFHGYDDGNLSWQAAFEVAPSALTVHAYVYTGDSKKLEIEGDYKLRDNFHKEMTRMLQEKGIKTPKKILDIGCSTGLSTIKLHHTYPEAEIIGVDMSPYMVAVARHELQQKSSLLSARSHVTYLHNAGEDSKLGEKDVDMVSACLVFHELPTYAARAIFNEAYRVLPAGGVFSYMDMNPQSEAFIKLASNPFAFAGFSSTEPWMREYVNMDLKKTLESCGFSDVSVASNSPRHRTVVAVKK